MSAALPTMSPVASTHVYPLTIAAAQGPHDEAPVDPLGPPIRVSTTRDRPIEGCALCAIGQCIQRVESCDAWECDVVVHGEARHVGS